MDKDKVEKASVAAIEKYLLPCSLIKSFINTNDKTPFWDGDLFVYKKDDQKGNLKDNFHGRVPIQVKGRSDNSTNFTISRAEANAYMNDGGCLFFKVLVYEDFSTKILYSILSRTIIKEHLQQSDEDIKFQLEEVPNNPLDFQQKVYDFVTLRNGEKVENSSPKEIAKLVERFEEIREFLGEIEDNEAKYELESLLDSIKNTKDNGTIGWRDKFIYYSRKAILLAINNIKGSNFAGLQFLLGTYLHKQKLYQYVEDFYQRVLIEDFSLATTSPNPSNYDNLAGTLNNLANLHIVQNRFAEAEMEFNTALKIRQVLAKKNPEIYNVVFAKSLNNLAVLHHKLSRFDKAEEEYNEALVIRRELAKSNHEAHIGDLTTILNNLAAMHKDLALYDKAEDEYNEVLEICRRLAKKNPNAYNQNVATALNNLGLLHTNIFRYKDAEEEFKEALRIRRELAEKNPNAYDGDVSETLHNMGVLHYSLRCYEEAEKEYEEALQYRRELAKQNPDAYNGDMADTLNNIAILHFKLAIYEKAEDELNEVLRIRRELAEKNLDAYGKDVADTLNNLAELHNKLNRYEEAEEEYQEALKIYRDLAKKNPDVYNGNVAIILNNLGNLHLSITSYEEADKELCEALKIRRELVEYNRDAHIGDVAMTLYNHSLLLLKDEKRLGEARAEANEALGIYKELAKKNPQIWNKDVEDTQELLEIINQTS